MNAGHRNASRDIPALAGMNFFSTLNPVLWCAMTAWEFQRCFPAFFERQGSYILTAAALFLLPMLFLTGVSAYLMAKFPCRNILSCSKTAEVLTTLFVLVIRPFLAPWALLPTLVIMTLLLGGEYAIYRPALRCYMALMLPKTRLSEAVGKVQGMAFAGAAFAVALAAAFKSKWVFWYDKSTPSICLILFAAFAVYGLLLATRVRAADALRPRARYVLLRHLRRTRREKQLHRKELMINATGEVFILALLIFVITAVTQYVHIHFTSAIDSELLLTLLMVTPLAGTAVGSIAGAHFSKGRAETGLIPGYGLLTALLLASFGCFSFLPAGKYECIIFTAGLFLFGLLAGILTVPFQAYQEFFVRRDLSPTFFAGFYFKFGIGFLSVVAVNALIYRFSIPVYAACFVLAVLTLILLLTAFRMMPVMLLRFAMRVLLHTLYRLRLFDEHKIPESGGALLVANRSSFVDMLLLTAATSRPIRFLMHESYFRYPLLHPWWKAAGFIEVPANKPKRLQKLFEETAQLLRDGELLCIFPEEDITRNGVMSGFRDGMKKMLPSDADIPVIPVRIGLTWGSIFSCYEGKFKLRRPQELPHPASVTAGDPVPAETSAYELRIILSELAAATENIPAPGERPFHSQFAHIAKRNPFGKPFIRELRGGKWKVPNHLRLLSKAILISRYLRRRHRDESEYIGVMLPNSLDFFLAFTAVLMADKTPAILNYTSSAEARQTAVSKAKIKCIITSREVLEKQNISAAPGMIFIDDIKKKAHSPFCSFWWKFMALILPGAELMKLVSPETWDDVNRTGVVLFSSGSTGIPKGIMLSHRNIIANVVSFSQAIAWTKKDRIAGNLPLFHSFGMSACLWMPLYTGAEVTMIPNPLDAVNVGKAMRERRATVLFATPSFLQLYMRRCKAEDFASLRLTVAGAEQLRDDIADKFYDLCGLMIAEAYGCTELSPVVSVNLANSLMELGVKVARRGSIGPSLPGVCAKVVDPSTFELLPEDTDGLLIVTGANVMQGYLGEPEKSAEVIRDGWYITGDIARMDKNGFITITGRLSRFSKIAGEMVPHELVEREINAILQPDERLVAVTGVADEVRGEKLVVFYTDERLLAPEQLVRALRQRQIPNLWIPKAEDFIKVDAIPLLGSGKLDLNALNELAKRFAGTSAADHIFQ